MTRDDDIGRALRSLAADVESGVRRPPARDILRRAGRHPAGRPAEAKPFPWAGIAGVAAVPFVAIGAVLISPAGAGILGVGEDRDPLPTASAPAQETAEPAEESPTTAQAPTAAAPQTGESALTPLTRVTVVLTDDRVPGGEPGQQCRRLTEADRFVDEADPVAGAVELLVEGPLSDERAVGLSSPVDPDAAAVALDRAARVVTVDVPDATAWRDGCGPEEFQRALSATVGQFDGWTWVVREGGVPLTPPADLVESGGAPDGDPGDGGASGAPTGGPEPTTSP
ncbi:MAG: hypothetical protein ACFCVG_18720 [Kineosporiaceae bacterium]